MRNLKKALALVLAMMMTLSLMVTASANDYADGAKITKTEAVEVMNMINVFQGDNTGNFDPAGELTRAQAAKIISYMKLGNVVAETLPKDEAPFPDVKADRWYTGYVTYAKAEGIIDGRTNGSFDPNGTLTGYEFGKMVLEAAGISGEYTGSSWKLNVSTALRGGNPAKTNLMANVDAVLNNPINRENACQLAFNALVYTANGETTGNFVITGSGLSLNGKVCATYSEAAILINLLDKENVSSYTIEAEKNTRGSLGDLVFGLGKVRGTDTFGAPANVWAAGDDSVTVADVAAKSYEKTTGKTIKSDLKMTGTVSAVVVTDGKAAGSAILTDESTFGGNGAQVDVYKVDDTNVKIVVVNTYVAVIASHTPAKGEAKEKITLTLDATNKPATTTATDFVTTKFTADDKGAVVLYTAKVGDDNNATIVDVTVPAEVKGTVTRFNTGSNTFVADGVTYKFSAKKHSAKGVSAANVGDELTLYLDNKGNVIYATGESGPDASYAVVVDWANTTAGGWASSGSSWSVKLLLTDGSIVEKTVAKVTEKGSDSAITPLNSTVFGGLTGTFVSYTEDNGAVTMAKTDDANTSEKFTEVKRNTPTLKDGLVANNKTIFMIGSKDGKTLTVYTGINTVPNVRKLTESGSDFVAVAADGVASFVYIAKSEPIPGTSTSSDVIYVVGAGDAAKDIDKGNYKTYAAVINGEIVELETVDSPTGLPTTDNSSALLSSVTKNEKGLVTAGTAMTGENVISNQSTVTAPANGVIKVGSNSYSYDDNTVVYMIEDGEISTVAMSAVEAMSNVKVDGYTKDGVIAELFILVLPAAPEVSEAPTPEVSVEPEASAAPSQAPEE